MGTALQPMNSGSESGGPANAGTGTARGFSSFGLGTVCGSTAHVCAFSMPELQGAPDARHQRRLMPAAIPAGWLAA